MDQYIWQCKVCGTITKELKEAYHDYCGTKIKEKICPCCGSRQITCITLPYYFNYNENRDIRNISREIDEDFLDREE